MRAGTGAPWHAQARVETSYRGETVSQILCPLASDPNQAAESQLRAVNRAPSALVAQWIEHRSPKPCAQVRFLPGALAAGLSFGG